MRNGIPISELPVLYQDAVTACRKLGTRYIWIDSLCIIQDQEQDWIKEASTMERVYSNSLCNFEAAHAADGDGRLFFSRSEEKIKPLPVTVQWHRNGPLASFLIDISVHRDNDMHDAPLVGRAWVLQEQLQAARTLIFSSTQVHWVCRTQEASEMFPKGVPDLRRGDSLCSRSLAPRPLHFLKKWIASDNPIYFDHWSMASASILSPWRGFCLSWRSIVLDYTSRSLTFEKDKLAAIAGLASVIQRKSKVQYIAGMWNVRFSIEFELCWRPKPQANGQPCFRPKQYRAPTWSWASIEGTIDYCYEEDHSVVGDDQLAYVEHAEVETIDRTPTGPLKSGSIRIRGPLEGKWKGAFDPDDEEDLKPETIFYLTMFALFRDHSPFFVYLTLVSTRKYRMLTPSTFYRGFILQTDCRISTR
jgi:Heterokaryon incompatibility protein (HET)